MEAVSLAIGTSGLITVVEKIFQISRISHDIKSFPSDMASLAMRLDQEMVKVNIWSLQACTHSRDTESFASSSADELQKVFSTTVARCIEGIRQNLEDAHAIMSSYIPGTLLDEPSDELRSQLKAELSDVNHSLLNEKRFEWFKYDVSTRKKVLAVSKPWGISHKEKLKEAIHNLKYWNDELLSLLNRQDLVSIRLQHSTLFMASHNGDRQALGTLSDAVTTSADEITTSARLALQVMDLQNTRLTALHPWYKPHLISDTNPSYHVDWLNCASLTPEQREIAASRINSLCQLLSNQMPRGLLTLKPVGYVFNPKKESFGIFSEAENAGKTIASLRSILGSSKYRRISLNERYTLARRLCRSFLELHKSRWLHRGFNSNCVNLWATSEREICDFAAITGFQFARPADDVSLANTQTRDGLIWYHHPEVRLNHKMGSRSYVRYTSGHDIFSLGMVLLEIGIWKRIVDVEQLPHADYSVEAILKVAAQRLPHLMGQRYAEIVYSCLRGMEPATDHEDAWAISWMLYKVVEPMNACHCV